MQQSTYKFDELRKKVKQIKSITPWDSVKKNCVFHIPPISTLERRDILIKSKGNVLENGKFIEDENGNFAQYVKLNDQDKDTKIMSETSVFARFLVKRKKF